MQSSIPAAEPESASRVSTIELFFDLVFVFTITQVSHLVLHAHGWEDLGRAFLVLTITWWMYGGYAWLTNNVSTSDTTTRLLMLTAMMGFFVMALSTPEAFGENGVAFGLGYLLVNVIHVLLFTRAPNSSAQAIWRIGPFNVIVALAIIAAGFLPHEWNWTLWVLAVIGLIVYPLFRGVSGFALQPAHFVERHGLVIIIALGESIVSIGVGAAEEPITPLLLTLLVLTLALLAAMWWLYFDKDDERAEHSLAHAGSAERARMGLYGYGHAHLFILSGIVVVAAGLNQLVEQFHEATTLSTAALLAGGVAVYLLGDVLFRYVLHMPSSLLRKVIAVVCLATIPLGVWAGGLVQVAVLVVLLVGVIAGERDPLPQNSR